MKSMSLFSSKRELIAASLLSTILFIYLFLRCVFVPIVHDEGMTFWWYIVPGQIIPGIAKLDANNHILNTFLTWISYLIFGDSELSLRLPNLFCFPVYVFFLFRIASLLRNIIVRWVFILTLLLTTTFFEYFGLSRGYGMSMAFLLASLWYVISFIKVSKAKYLINSLFFMNLATLANLTMVNSFLIILCFLFIYINFIYNIQKKIIIYFIFLIGGIIPFLMYVFYGMKLSSNGLLFYGDDGGFWDTTVKSLIGLFIWQNNKYWEILVIVFFGLICFSFIFLLWRDSLKKLINLPFFIFFILLLFNIIANITSHYLLGTKYLMYRTGIFYFPFFIACICFAVEELKPFMIIVLIPLLFFPLHFVYRINITHSTHLPTSSCAKEFYDYLHSINNNLRSKIMVGTDSESKFIFYYYDRRNNANLVSNVFVITENGFSDYDFLIVKTYTVDTYPNYETLITHHISGYSLLRRK